MWEGLVARMGEVECGQSFGWRTRRKGSLGTNRHRWGGGAVIRSILEKYDRGSIWLSI
jgi:hypothetical protein